MDYKWKFILTVLEAGTLRSGCQSAWSGSGENSLLAERQSPHYVLTWQRERDFLDQSPTLMTSFKLNYLWKTLPPDMVTLGLGASMYEFWQDTFQSMAF